MSLETTTFFDDPYFDDYDLKEPSEPSEAFHTFYFYFFIIYSIFSFFLYIGALVSDIYLIVIMCKFKKFRNRINNLFLMYLIFNMMYIVLIFLIMLDLHMFGAFWIYFHDCAIANFDHLALTLSFCTLAFLAFDWYILNYHPYIYNKFPRAFKYGIGCVILILVVLQWLITSIICYTKQRMVHELRFFFEATSFIICGIVLICLTILKGKQKPISSVHKTEYAFIIPVMLFLIEFFAYFTKFLTLLLDSRLVNVFMWHVLRSIANDLYLAQPIIVLYLMIKFNKSFKIAQIRCCRKNVQEYDDDDMDSVSIEESHENHVKFDKGSEEIRF